MDIVKYYDITKITQIFVWLYGFRKKVWFSGGDSQQQKLSPGKNEYQYFPPKKHGHTYTDSKTLRHDMPTQQNLKVRKSCQILKVLMLHDGSVHTTQSCQYFTLCEKYLTIRYDIYRKVTMYLMNMYLLGPRVYYDTWHFMISLLKI